jgi:hypothetical protein
VIIAFIKSPSPKTEIDEPTLAKARKDKHDPRQTAFIIDNSLPEILQQLLTERLEANSVLPRMDRGTALEPPAWDPWKYDPWREREDPSLQYVRSDNELPKQAESRTLRLDPALQKFLRLRLLPRTVEQWTEK